MLQDIHSSLHRPGQFNLPPGREAESAPLMKAARLKTAPNLPKEIAPFSLPAVVNHGRWIVECPCGGAQLASRTDKRFFCIDCGNVAFEGKWVHVEWPDEAEEIEAELDQRFYPKQRNWRPGQTSKDLRDEARGQTLPDWVKPVKGPK
jgi:hypothetical protein